MMDYIWFWVARQLAELMFVAIFFSLLFAIPMVYFVITGWRKK